MIKVVIPVKTAHEAMEYMNRLIADGLKNGVDFKWWFLPRVYNDSSFEDDFDKPAPQAFVQIEFTDDSVATFYQLKWTQ